MRVLVATTVLYSQQCSQREGVCFNKDVTQSDDKLTGSPWLTLELQRWYFLAVPVQVILSFPATTFFLDVKDKHLEE